MGEILCRAVLEGQERNRQGKKVVQIFAGVHISLGLGGPWEGEILGFR